MYLYIIINIFCIFMAQTCIVPPKNVKVSRKPWSSDRSILHFVVALITTIANDDF